MKQFILFVLLIGLQGCEKPGPVDIRPEDPDDILIVSPIEQADSFDAPSVDTLGVVPGVIARAAGYFLINQVSIDGGQGVLSFAYSTVLLADRQRPIVPPGGGGRIYGYHGFFIPSLTLNGQPMLILPHIVRTGSDTVHAGFEFFAHLTSSYQPNTQYRWGFRTGIGDTSGILIRTPDQLSVLSPIGGSIHLRTRGLPIAWTGTGNLRIIISQLRSDGRLNPLVNLRPRVNRGHALIPPSLLRDRVPGTYALTFILANQQPGIGSTVEVFIQAASVHTTYFRIQ